MIITFKCNRLTGVWKTESRPGEIHPACHIGTLPKCRQEGVIKTGTLYTGNLQPPKSVAQLALCGSLETEPPECQ